MALPSSSNAPPPPGHPGPHHPSGGLYPRIIQHSANPIARRIALYSPLSAIGIGTRVALKPEHRITPPPQFPPQYGDVHGSAFDFDFDVERKILDEAEKDNPDWSELALGDIPQETPDRTDPGSSEDPILNKYIASGLNSEAWRQSNQGEGIC